MNPVKYIESFKLDTEILERLFQDYLKDIRDYPIEWHGQNFLNILLFGDWKAQFASVKDLKLGYRHVWTGSNGKMYTVELQNCLFHMYIPDSHHKSLEHILDTIRTQFDVSGYIWFSYMGAGVQLSWHIDEVPTRLHFVIKNDSKSPSIEYRHQGNIFMEKGKGYLMDPSTEHRIPTQSGERLHLVASIKNNKYF